MNADAFGHTSNSWPDFYGCVLCQQTARGWGCDCERKHTHKHTYTHQQIWWHSRACMCAHDYVVTQAMSAGPVVCDVISLSCSVSVFSYSQVDSSEEHRAAKTGPNRPTLNLHSSLHRSSHLTLLYKITLTDIRQSDMTDHHWSTSGNTVIIGSTHNHVTN